jgi:hypothetical protein
MAKLAAEYMACARSDLKQNDLYLSITCQAPTIEMYSVVVGEAHPGGGGKWYPTGTDPARIARTDFFVGTLWGNQLKTAKEGGGGHGYERLRVRPGTSSRIA